MQCILNPSLLFLQLSFAGRADVDLSHAASQFGEAFLELLTVVVGVGSFDFPTDLIDATLNVCRLADTFDNRAGISIDDDLLGSPKLGDADLFKIDAPAS